MSKRILIIDDEATNIRIMQSRLTGEGYEVVIARDGDVGLERVQKESPDLIILDIEMPRMNGYFFISELKKLGDQKDIPVIVITSHDDMEAAFASKGIQHYMVKPIDFDQLFNKIQSILTA